MHNDLQLTSLYKAELGFYETHFNICLSLRVKRGTWGGQWRHMPLIPALGRHRQADLCEFEASLVYRASKLHRETQSLKTKAGGREEGKEGGTWRETVPESVGFSERLLPVCTF